ncbi:MAG TPA: site-specific integrase [Myxococcales bacterium]
MGGIRARGDRLYWNYRVPGQKKREWKRSPYKVGQEKQAEAALEIIESALAAQEEQGLPAGPLTVGTYVDNWVSKRRDRGMLCADTEAGFVKHHIKPALGSVLLQDLRPRDVRDFVRALRCKHALRNRARDGAKESLLSAWTVHHVYGCLHNALSDAVVDELITVNPCELRRGELPKRTEADPTRRAGATFSREELEALISDPRIPEDRRVYYAIGFLGGLRPGEIIALRWSRYDAQAQPLGQLVVATAFNTNARKERDTTKTGVTKLVPVHPTLAKVLAAWKLAGYERLTKKKPEPGDLMVPGLEGGFRGANWAREKFYQDLKTLGFERERRWAYDTRATFMTLTRTDGGRDDVLRLVTHASRRDVVDGYTRFPWAVRCAEVAKLKVGLREGKLYEMPKAQAVGAGPVEEPPCKLQKLQAPGAKAGAKQEAIPVITRPSDPSAIAPRAAP